KNAPRELDQVIVAHEKAAELRYVINDKDTSEDDIDELYDMQRECVQRTRYVALRSKHRKHSVRWDAYICGKNVINGGEFLQHFRVTREAFKSLVALIKDDRIFKGDAHRTFRGDASSHLLVLLKLLETFDSDNTSSKRSLFFGLSKGSIDNCICRAISAVPQLEQSMITWLDAQERKIIANWIKKNTAL
uniref:DDE Tnp4 domain-containing protein n=1 Tax=Globisporangium ultimum (strain ATCC 200006 / CBS 805.95 / DAOM BR144) TaxID=431595 RepID=K3W8B1_GLOUD